MTETSQDLYGKGTEPWVTDVLAALCRALGVVSAVEIGVWRGMTTLALAQSCRHVVGIDQTIRPDAVQRLAGHKNVVLLEGDASEVLRQLSWTFDFAFIDAGHHYEEVAEQTTALWPLLTPEAIVAYHDSLSAEAEYGVNRFINDRFPEALQIRTRPFEWASMTGLALVQKRLE